QLMVLPFVGPRMLILLNLRPTYMTGSSQMIRYRRTCWHATTLVGLWKLQRDGGAWRANTLLEQDRRTEHRGPGSRSQAQELCRDGHSRAEPHSRIGGACTFTNRSLVTWMISVST